MEKEVKNEEMDKLKNEATNTVKEVKETIKNVDIKKDSLETKGFVTEMFKNPLEKIKEIVTKGAGKTFTYAMIILAVWTVAVLIKQCFIANSSWFRISDSVLSIIKVTITPALSILAMSFILFLMNKKEKKSLTTIITAVTSANIPVAIASIISLLTLIGTNISYITSPISKLCAVISTVFIYFTAKSIFGTEKNSEFIKKFILIEVIYYVIYLVVSFLGIYII